MKTNENNTICIASPFPPPYGGMAVQAEKLAVLLEKEGYSVIRIQTNVALHGILSIFSYIPFVRTIIRSLVFLFQLNAVLGRVKTIYFLTGFYNFFFWVTYPALLLMLLRKQKIILSARGGEARNFFQQYRFFVKPVLTKIDAVTVPSGFLKAAFKEELGLDTIIVPNIADLKQFSFVKRAVFKPKMIATRSLEPIYDVETVIRAFHIIYKQFPEATLGIVGNGSLRASLEHLVQEMGLRSSVIFYGEVKHKQIHKLYSQYDIFMNASRVDNLPGSILEAFAAGLPVVSTNAGGIPHMVVHKENGLLTDIGDHEGLAANALHILHNPDFGQALAMKGYIELQKYTWPHIRSIITPLLDHDRT